MAVWMAENTLTEYLAAARFQAEDWIQTAVQTEMTALTETAVQVGARCDSQDPWAAIAEVLLRKTFRTS